MLLCNAVIVSFDLSLSYGSRYLSLAVHVLRCSVTSRCRLSVWRRGLKGVIACVCVLELRVCENQWPFLGTFLHRSHVLNNILGRHTCHLHLL